MSQKEKNQRERVDDVLKHVRAPSRVEIGALEELLAITQNGPPEGERDASMNEVRWYILRSVTKHAGDLSEAIDAWKTLVEDAAPCYRDYRLQRPRSF